MKALNGCIASVLSAIIVATAESEGRAMLHGLLNQFADIRFLMMTYVLDDVVGILTGCS